MAIEMGNLSIVSVLLEAKGIDVTLRNRIGKTGMEKKKTKKTKQSQTKHLDSGIKSICL